MIEDEGPLIRAATPVWRRAVPYVWGLGAVAAAGGIAYGLEKVLPLPNLSLVFLSAVLLVAMRFGALPAIYAGLLSFAIYNFFFTPPYFTFFVTHEADSLTLAFFLLVAALTGNVVGRARSQLLTSRVSERRASMLYDFSRKAAAATGLDEVIGAVKDHVAAAIGAEPLVFLPAPGNPNDPPAAIADLPPADAAAAALAWRDGIPAGRAARAGSGASRLYMPLRTARGRVGLLGVVFADGRAAVTAEQEDLLRAVADQAAVAIERAQLAAAAEDARLLSETETLRAALLSSVSHDLRTPLVSIIGSATTLSEVGEAITAAERGELVGTILQESQRLNRFVQNLLDMTRLGYGGLSLRRDWADLEDVIGHAVSASRDILAPFSVRVEIGPGVPLVFVDPVLIEQVFVNILDNAAKYSPPGGAIAIRADASGGRVAIRFADQGPGIPPEDRERIFDMFTRVRAGDSRVAGTGLGLAICRGLVAAHGGVIAAGTAPDGKGAEIVVSLPLTPPPPDDDADEGDPI